MTGYPNEQEEKVAKERHGVYCREVRDFARTGDRNLMKRIIFRNFVLAPTPSTFKFAKARALMMLMASDNSMSMNVNVY